ncbi:P-loop containing nucleoside triphosphate hydrolase protein, partial [Daedaleopsis nitida]
LSMRNLQAVRQRAATDKGYNSATTRNTMTTRFRTASGGKKPYEWQLDVAEAFHLGLDCIVIAGTGSGKTIPYLLPLLLPENEKKMIPVISPLKSLQRDQAKRFKKLGVRARAVNGDTWCQPLRKMCLRHAEARDTLRAMGLAGGIAGFVVDEAHCISQWGGQFHPHYSNLGELRTFTPQRCPIAAFSATMAPGVLSE